jgi:hypothetical protein
MKHATTERTELKKKKNKKQAMKTPKRDIASINRTISKPMTLYQPLPFN